MDFFEVDLTELERIVKTAFAEDRVEEDITTAACIEEGAWAQGRIILKESGCIAGLAYLPWIFGYRDARIATQVLVREGTICSKGTVLAEVRGPAASLLSSERVALNFLQHLSGIATLTALCVKETNGTKCKILDTRKTILGLRSLQKYAVRIGGGQNHRPDLGSQILIKNNHLALSNLLECISKARNKLPDSWIEVEVDRPEEALVAIDAGANAILLDNMTPDEVKEAVKISSGRAFLEASGGIRLENIHQYAATGIDAVSIGALTHSVRALDISIRING